MKTSSLVLLVASVTFGGCTDTSPMPTANSRPDVSLEQGGMSEIPSGLAHFHPNFCTVPCGQWYYGVSASPHGSFVTSGQYQAQVQTMLYVTNTGTLPDRYNITCTTTGPATCVSWPTSVSPPPGQTADLNITYSTGAPCSDFQACATVKIIATDVGSGIPWRDSAWINVHVNPY